jgi:hypothetical protein
MECSDVTIRRDEEEDKEDGGGKDEDEPSLRNPRVVKATQVSSLFTLFFNSF